ncbi:MAG TPA: SRPBCC family protein [Microbacterium sp.]|uniref:SRPBCC family protein n=1 Tax=Microbacterium sp. TaxID=51671 RepID=UPI002CA9A65A|nr:SRPBCC family protein [Microbacterium sp.]HWI32520.1 SRPBCC family protein [Microbacterium sp.]
MAGFKMSEWISRPPQDVFEFITAPENAPRVVPTVKSMVTLTDGPIHVGTRYRETRVMRGKEEHAELEVVAYEPGQKYAVQNLTEGIETVYQYAFRPEADGTRVDLLCDVKAGGAKKLLLPLVVAELRKEDGDHLQRLKELLEAEGAPGAR